MPVKSLRAFETGQPWPPESEKDRLARYKQNRILWKGKDDRLGFRVENYTKALSDPAHFILNIHKRLSTLWADMLFGEQPLWSAGDEDSAEHNNLQTLIERVGFNSVGYEVSLDNSIYGDGIFRVGLEGGKATIDAQPPKHWFPVVSPNNIRRVQAHVLADVIETGTTLAKSHYLILEIHTRGQIQHKAFKLNGFGDGKGKIGDKVPISTILPEIAAREDVGDAGLENTGLDDFLIIPVPNLRTSDEAYGRDDYSDLDTIINGLEERLDQINDILKKHAEPFMYGSQLSMRQGADGLWYFDTQGKFIPVLEPGTGEKPILPGYVTWDGKLDDALNNFNLLMEQLYFVSETTPAAFGQQKEGLADSGSALKRLMIPVLQKVGRLQLQFDPAMKRALQLAAKLEDTDIGDVGAQWRDGLPEDTLETAQAVNYYVMAGVMSRYEAVQTRHPDWNRKQIMDELNRIDEDAAATAGSSGGLPPGAIDPTNGGGSDEQPTDQAAQGAHPYR